VPHASVTKRPAPRGFVLSSPYDPTPQDVAVMRRHLDRKHRAKGRRNGAYRHGMFTCEAIAMRCAVNQLVRESRALMDKLSD
jgi:hypothetical protein